MLLQQSARPLLQITEDKSPVIRRAVLVDGSSAKIDVRAEAGPAVVVDPSGEGTGIPVVATRLANKPHAWTATGQVKVTVGPTDAAELAKWNFGFIQFMKVNLVNLFYAGRIPSDGGILIQPHVRPALRTNLGRDSDFAITEPNPPWTNINTSGDKTFNAAKGVASFTMGDHPHMVVDAIMRNTVTTFRNFMFEFIDDREFVSVFTSQDSNGKFQPLAHFRWSVRWHFQFIWKGSFGFEIPAGFKLPSSAFRMGDVVLGEPSLPEIKKLLVDPGKASRLGTRELTAAIQACIRAGAPPNLFISKERIGTVPPNFIAR